MTHVTYSGRAYPDRDGVAEPGPRDITGEFTVIDEIYPDPASGQDSGALIVQDAQGQIWSITDSDMRRYADDQRY